MGPPPRTLVLVAVALPCITTASSLLNASALRSNATALGLELLEGPVPVPAANKSFWTIAYPENYYDPQCQKRPRILIADCECACNALGGTLACIENPELPLALNDMKRGTYGSSCPPCDCDSRHVLKSCRIFEDLESVQWNVDSWNGDIKADVLKLSAKGIKRIEVGAFGENRFASNVKFVRSLDLSMNDIKSLEPGVFDGLESLRAVNIYGNPVQCVEIDPAALRRADGVQITCEA